MKRLIFPLLLAFSLPNILFAETSFDRVFENVLDEYEQVVHNRCLKYVDYAFCRELDRKTWRIIGDLKRRDKSSMFKLMGDICEAAENGLLANTFREFYLLREIYKAHYPATEEEKKMILYENTMVRSDIYEIVNYAVDSYPGCYLRED